MMVMVGDRLLLFELEERAPCAYVDWEGVVRLLPNGEPYVKADAAVMPSIVFGDVPVRLHLSCGLTIGPLAEATAGTGDEGAAS